MITQQTISVEYVCKICRQPGVAKFAIVCPQEWLEKLHPMLTHDRCFDRHVGFVKAGDRLVAACLEIARGSKDSVKIAASLSGLARSYAKAFSDKHGTPMVYHDDFTDLLREKPEQVGRILAHYRKQVFSVQPPLPDSE